MGTIKLTIDGQTVEVETGKTVLEAARIGGIEIPTVCAHPDLPNYGACRMCIVEIEGVRGYPTSCTTPAAEGMKVKTKTPELVSLRNRVLELMLSGHPSACLVCDHRALCEQFRQKSTKAGKSTRCAFCSNRDECAIRDLALSANAHELHLPTIYSQHLVERDDPFMDRDYNLCVLCGRCWRICEKIHGQPAISIMNRGRWSRLGTSFGKSHVYSGCTFCGACIDICPTGSLSDRYARWYGEPDREVPSACLLCSEGCSFNLQIKAGKTIAGLMTAFNQEARLCALGRFAYAQIVNAPDRIRRVMVKRDQEQIPSDGPGGIAAAAEALKNYQDGSFLLIGSAAETREVKHFYRKFALEVMKGRIAWVPAGGGIDEITPAETRADLKEGKFKAALVTGDYLDAEMIAGLSYLIAIDFLPSPATAAADVVWPAAILAEVNGSFKNSQGEIKSILPASAAPGAARPELEIVRDLARAMGAAGFEFSAVTDVTRQIQDDPAPAPVKGSPRDRLPDLVTRYRGHYIADAVCALEAIGLPSTPKAAEVAVEGEGFLVLSKKEVVPNFHLVKVKAPQVAKFSKPGQFAIVMVKETSERVPFTLVDWDPEEESATLVIEEVGRSSREVALLKTGDKIAHVVGPLGLPLPIKNFGTVVLGGGCYGIGSIYPIARAMKAAGNRVVCVIEASSHYLFYMVDELRKVCDELLIATKDGSRGTKGGVQEVFVNLVETGIKVDQFVAIGCTFMMKMASDATKPYGIPTWVALNPIMVDGTGMCGACRLTVAGETKFACVDGPMFNGHEVDWDELFSRRSAYALEEIEAMPQGARVVGPSAALAPDLGPSCAGGGREKKSKPMVNDDDG